MKIIFDTGAFVALFIAKELDHHEVLARYNFYRHEHAKFFTTDYILDELFTWCGRKTNADQTTKIIMAIETMKTLGQLQIIPIDTMIFNKAQEMLIKFFEHKISFTDCTTAVLFKELNMDEIFTLDTDFKKLRLPVSFPRLK